jgi:hypothetical protein
MKKSDIGVVAVFYAICAFFYANMLRLKADSQTYPRFTIVLLFGLTTLYLLQMAVKARRYGVQKGRDEAFEGFLPVQFLVCLARRFCIWSPSTISAFYISTVIFMAALLLF